MDRAGRYGLGETFGIDIRSGQDGGVGVIGPSPVCPPLCIDVPSSPVAASSAMTVSIILLLAAAGAIYVACEFFVNGVEWVGRKLAVGQKATGTILAAFGTALPESVVTLVAVAFGTAAADKDIGVGRS